MLHLILPYSDVRKEQNRRHQLDTFLAYMTDFLSDDPFRIYIMEQATPAEPFNRGALLNAGFQVARACANADTDWFIFHDIDLLPSEELLPFYCVQPEPETVYHLASLWTRYPSRTFFGGIVSFGAHDFERVNGFPNDFWGWGGEDDELRRRVCTCELAIATPPFGAIKDLEELSLDAKLAYLKQHSLMNPHRKQAKYAHASTWRTNGLLQTKASTTLFSAGSHWTHYLVSLELD